MEGSRHTGERVRTHELLTYCCLMDNLTELRIKEAANIVEVITDFLPLKRSGKEWKGRCPFHGDRHDGSFMVNATKNIATCFPCNKTWDAVGFVKDYLGMTYPDALQYLAQKFGVPVDDSKPIQWVRTTPQRPKELPARMWPLEWVKIFKADRSDNFVNWLYTLPWDNCQRQRIGKVLDMYGVGHSHFEQKGEVHDFTIFWQCDELANLHNGHLMKYTADGHRVKDEGQYPQTWIHRRMERAKTNPFNDEKERASYCLFGQHLLAAYPNAVVNIVESEKTAIVMSIAYGCQQAQIWMACCGLANLVNSRHLLAPIIRAGRRIVLYPDRDGVDKWKETAATVPYNWLSVNDEPVTKWWRERDGEKADIADVVLRMLEDHKPRKYDPLQELEAKNPAFKTLNEKFKLQIQ